MSEEQNIEEQPEDNRPRRTDDSEKSAERTSFLSEENKTVDDEVIQHSTPNIQHNSESMEVHHHGHVHEKKKWIEYLFQFLMMFLAVFCGFLAENQREHLIEHRREKQYIQNLLQDLIRDTGAIGAEIRFRHRRSGLADSLIRELSSAENLTQAGNIYFYAYSLTTIRIFGYSNTTISQLKNSGSMRLIRKKAVADSINAYDIAVDMYKIREDAEREIIGDYRKAICHILDGNVMLSMEDSTMRGFGYKRPEITIPLLSKEANILNPVKDWRLSFIPGMRLTFWG